MILRTLEPDPPDGKYLALFVTSESAEDYKYVQSLIESIYNHMEKKGGKKLPRNQSTREEKSPDC